MLIGFFVTTSFARGQAVFIPFGWPSQGSSGGHAFSVSADGSIVAGDVSGGGLGVGPFLWTEATGYQFPPGIPGLFGGSTHDISADGGTAVGWLTNGLPVAVRWDESGARALGDLPGGRARSIAGGVSADGTVIVGLGENAIGEQAFRWTEQTGMVGLPGLPNTPGKCYANGVSDDGRIAVGTALSVPTRQRAVAWNEQGEIISLSADDPDSLSSYSVCASADGSVIAGVNSSSTNGWVPFRWTAETGMVSYSTPLSRQVLAFGMSADGRFIVGEMANPSFGSNRAFIWDGAHGIRTLQDMLAEEYGLVLPSGWVLQAARDISDDGMTIVGTAAHFPNAIPQPFMVRLPEPSTLALLVASMLIYVRKR